MFALYGTVQGEFGGDLEEVGFLLDGGVLKLVVVKEVLAWHWVWCLTTPRLNLVGGVSQDGVGQIKKSNKCCIMSKRHRFCDG